MLSKSQALIQLKNLLPGVPVKAWADYNDLYLFRVEYLDPLEKDWDPFFSVDKVTGEARDFSVLTDIGTEEFVNLEWNEV